MEQAEKSRSQFNLQADRFAFWEVTGNEVNLERFSRFCELRADDVGLDVACGTGNMVIYCAPGIASMDGVDIAERMIDLARGEAERRHIGNATFSVGQVECLPYADSSHTLVMSRAAFHHFADPWSVLNEMLRCSRPGGRLCIQDIIAFGDQDIDTYVEDLEKAIDSSHCRTLRSEQFTDMFTRAGLAGIHGVEFCIHMDLANYVGHAVQSDSMNKEVARLIEYGLEDPKLSRIFKQRDGRLLLSRKVLFLGGRKEDRSRTSEGLPPPRIVRLNLGERLGG